MKISVNWIREFTDIKLSTDELVKKIGAQLGEVESVQELGDKYKDVVVAKVVTCRKHPNADKLNVCLIDDNKKTKNVKRDGNGHVQVVCGAPNVRAGITVAWLPPGAIVPSTYDKEQFKLEVRPLRGVDSNGMIASGKELAINDDHDGILVLDKPTKPGTKFADVYQLNDTIIEIENKMFTHRPDLFGIIGIAREIAGIQQIKFKSPDWYTKSLELRAKSSESLPITVLNKIPDLAQRFMIQTISGVTIKPSPIIMQSYLSRLGMKPINNIVDITNFVMTLTSQPLHAYDYDKLCAVDKSKKATIMARKPTSNEKVTLIGGKTIAPSKKTICIASKTKLIGLGGVMGGSETEVDGSTKNIVLECATFDMFSIRRTSMAHGVFSDAVTRFNKGQSPLQNDKVLAYTSAMVEKIAGGQITAKAIDNRAKATRPKKVATDAQFVNSRLGLDLTTSEIVRLLTNVEFDVTREKTKLLIKPPFWRTDIEIPEDIVEEVGRLYGYDHLPLALPKRTLQPVVRNELLELKTKIRHTLSSFGANELLTYSFVHGNLLERTTQDKKQAYKLSNALSPDLQYYRLTLTPSLLDKVHPNIKAGFDEFALFEINKTHNNTHIDKNDKLPAEQEMTALVIASSNKADYPAYYKARKYLDELAAKLGMKFAYKVVKDSPKYAVTVPFDLIRSAYVTDVASGVFVGIVGEYKQSVIKALKLPQNIAGFEIGTEHLLEALPKTSSYKPISKYPSTHQDITLKVAAGVGYIDLEQSIVGTITLIAEKKNYIHELSPISIFQKPGSDSKNITFRLSLSHSERTLVTTEVNAILENIAKDAKQKIKAERI